MSRLTHTDAEGKARLVDVTDKPDTRREARAEARVRMSAENLRLLLHFWVASRIFSLNHFFHLSIYGSAPLIGGSGQRIDDANHGFGEDYERSNGYHHVNQDFDDAGAFLIKMGMMGSHDDSQVNSRLQRIRGGCRPSGVLLGLFMYKLFDSALMLHYGMLEFAQHPVDLGSDAP